MLKLPLKITSCSIHAGEGSRPLYNVGKLSALPSGIVVPGLCGVWPRFRVLPGMCVDSLKAGLDCNHDSSAAVSM